MVIVMHKQLVDRPEFMLRITTEKKRGKTILNVEGRLAGPLVGTLEQCWREFRGASPREKFQVDLCGVSFIDAAGKVLLKEIHRQGGELIAEGCLNQAIVREIEVSERSEKSSEEKSQKRGSHIIFWIALFSLAMSPTLAHAQAAKQQGALPGSAPTRVLRLTLDQAVALAIKQNPTAQVAVLTAAQSE